MPKDRLLWEVQTLAANVSEPQLQQLRKDLELWLGSSHTREIIEQWEHELEEDDDQ